MKKFFLFAAAMMMLASCTSNDDALTEQVQDNRQETVTLSFAPYDMEAMTRATTPIGNMAQRLDIWVFEGDSATALTQTDTIAAVHQQKGDDGFGSLTLTLNRTKTYTLYAIAHTHDTPATFTQGVVAFPNNVNSPVLRYTKTFTPADTKTLDCRMQRAVGMFRVIITDTLPASVVRLRVACAKAAWQYSFPQGKGIKTGQIAYNWTNFSTVTKSDGTTVLDYYFLAADTEQQYDISVKGADSSSVAVKERVFTSVPIRNGYRTVYRGEFFTDSPFAPTFTVDADWHDYDTVEF